MIDPHPDQRQGKRATHILFTPRPGPGSSVPRPAAAAPLPRPRLALFGAERTVALLAFDDAKGSPVGDLMDIAQRQKTASELNAAILSSQAQEREPRLPMLLKLLLWAQAQLDERAAYPRVQDIVTAQLVPPKLE